MRIRFVLIVVGIVLLSGCYRAWVSQGQITPAGEWSSHTGGAGSSIFGPDIEIFVKASKGVSNDNPLIWNKVKEPAPPLGISLWFNPKQPNFTFNPHETFVLLPGMDKLKPSRIVTKLAGLGKSADWTCESNKVAEFKPGPPSALRHGSCFELYFNAKTPPLESLFEMKVEGLTRDGNHIVVPEIQFQKGSFWIMILPFFP